MAFTNQLVTEKLYSEIACAIDFGHTSLPSNCKCFSVNYGLALQPQNFSTSNNLQYMVSLCIYLIESIIYINNIMDLLDLYCYYKSIKMASSQPNKTRKYITIHHTNPIFLPYISFSIMTQQLDSAPVALNNLPEMQLHCT